MSIKFYLEGRKPIGGYNLKNESPLIISISHLGKRLKIYSDSRNCILIACGFKKCNEIN